MLIILIKMDYSCKMIAPRPVKVSSSHLRFKHVGDSDEYKKGIMKVCTHDNFCTKKNELFTLPIVFKKSSRNILEYKTECSKSNKSINFIQNDKIFYDEVEKDFKKIYLDEEDSSSKNEILGILNRNNSNESTYF